MDEPSLDFQKIGEMFVKQYYTQMHKDPTQMHRFYMDNSTLTRGGSELGKEEPIVGQKLIHDKILSLGLQQVHTKIRQVDSHCTISNSIGPAIVVQVTGELSTAGQPMRPFVQTFVLAQESLKKYYIHNDIFRYQIYDEDLVSDTEPVEDTTPETETVNVENTSSREGTPFRTQDDGLSADFQKVSPSTNAGGAPIESPPSWGGDQFVEDTPTELNGLPEETHHSLVEEHTELSEVHQSEETEVSKTPQDISWASRLKSTSSNTSNVGSTTSIRLSSTNKSASTASTASQSRAPPNNVLSQQPLPQREPKQTRKQEVRPPLDKKPMVATPSTLPTSATRSTPDSHQVFVGNLPNGTTEDELKSLFQRYGNVVEVRINPKNFGFIVFDSEEPVQTIIGSRSENHIMLNDRKLNIEEKRPSQRALGGGGGFGNRKPPMGGAGFSNRQPRVTTTTVPLSNKPPRR